MLAVKMFLNVHMYLVKVSVCVAAMKADRKRLKVEKADLVSQMQQLYTTLESREEQLREFIRNYDQHRKVTPAQLIYQYYFIADMSAITRDVGTEIGKTCLKLLGEFIL